MRITFVLPGMFVAGGVRAVLELATELSRLGHEVTVVCCESSWRRFRSLRWGLRREIRNTLQYVIRVIRGVPGVAPWIPCEARVISAPDLSARFIPSGDVVIATSWETAEWVASYPPSRGRRWYFVQHYETWAGPKDRVDRTYRLPLRKIVVSTWLKGLVEGTFGQRVFGPVICGVRFEQFFNPTKVFHESRTIGMMVSHIDWKGTEDGIAALRLVTEKHSKIRLVFFGWVGNGSKLEFPAAGSFFPNPDQAKLRELYSACDIWVCPSWHEGGGLPCQEAAACQCAIVTTDVGAVRDIYVDGHSALVSPPRDPEALAANILRLLEDDDLLRSVSRNTYENIQRFTWDAAARQVAGYLEEA